MVVLCLVVVVWELAQPQSAALRHKFRHKITQQIRIPNIPAKTQNYSLSKHTESYYSKTADNTNKITKRENRYELRKFQMFAIKIKMS